MTCHQSAKGKPAKDMRHKFTFGIVDERPLCEKIFIMSLHNLPFINSLYADPFEPDSKPIDYNKQCNVDIQYALRDYEVDHLWFFQGRVQYDEGDDSGTKINVYHSHFNNDDLKLTTHFCTHTYCAGSIAYKIKAQEQEKALTLVNINYFHPSIGFDDPRSYRYEGSAAFVIQDNDICYVFKDRRKCQSGDDCPLKLDDEDFGTVVLPRALESSTIIINSAVEDYKKGNSLKLDEIEPDP